MSTLRFARYGKVTAIGLRCGQEFELRYVGAARFDASTHESIVSHRASVPSSLSGAR